MVHRSAIDCCSRYPPNLPQSPFVRHQGAVASWICFQRQRSQPDRLGRSLWMNDFGQCSGTAIKATKRLRMMQKDCLDSLLSHTFMRDSSDRINLDWQLKKTPLILYGIVLSLIFDNTEASLQRARFGPVKATLMHSPTIKDLSFKTKKLMTQLDRLLFKDNTLTTHFRIDSVTAQLTRLHQFMASADMVAQDAGYYDYDGDDDEDYGGNEDDYQTESQVETHEGNNADQTLPNDSTDQEKEPNASRMTALQTVTRNLLLSSRIERQNVDVNWVRRSSFSKNDFTTKECEVVAKTVRILRSYIPSQGPQGQEHPGRHNPLLLAPFCIIANTLLRAAGYSKFTRRLSPIPSVADLHALTLSSTGLFEVLCGYQDGRFKVCGPDGPITDFQQVTKSVANRDAMFASFFDMNTIKNLCASHGVVFAQRVTYVDRLTVRILGDKIQPPLHNAVRSALDSKRKSHAKTGGAKWSSESRLVRDLGFDAAEEAKVVTEELRLTESDLRTINKDITRTTKSICNVKKAVDVSGRVDISNVAGSSGSDEMNDTDVDMEVEEDQRCLLKELRGTLSELQLKRIPLAEAVRQLKSTRYYWQKCSKSIPGTGPNIPAEWIGLWTFDNVCHGRLTLEPGR
ncbi:MAG: hypothetical protein J3R72DRAFT_505014 [Linnemannia gamsii]|nr:MAG: hypothetical protein J3R72DRAFT_505014 [Linnemannia gamsii]